jgi:predicted nucleotidyltransferase
MSEQLEGVFGRKVDLITREAVERNPSRTTRESILGSAKLCASV